MCDCRYSHSVTKCASKDIPDGDRILAVVWRRGRVVELESVEDCQPGWMQRGCRSQRQRRRGRSVRLTIGRESSDRLPSGCAV